jgi:Polysaccharide lyase
VLRRVATALCAALVALGAAAGAAGAGWPALVPRAATLPSPPPVTPSVPLFLGSSVDGFALDQSAPGAIAEVPDPAGSGETVFKMTVADHDVFPLTPTHDPRAELLSPATIEPGDEFWWSAKFLLPRSFPAPVPGWVTVLEGPYGPPYFGTPPWHIEVTRDRIQWSRNRTYGWDVPWKMPLVRGQWVEVLVHGRLAAHGFVEMWVDGRRVVFFRDRGFNPGRHAPTTRLRMQTLDRSNDEGPNYVSILNYRRHGMFPSVTVLQGQTALGPTRASVEPSGLLAG